VWVRLGHMSLARFNLMLVVLYCMFNFIVVLYLIGGQVGTKVGPRPFSLVWQGFPSQVDECPSSLSPFLSFV
jgi:hypothetical protein